MLTCHRAGLELMIVTGMDKVYILLILILNDDLSIFNGPKEFGSNNGQMIVQSCVDINIINLSGDIVINDDVYITITVDSLSPQNTDSVSFNGNAKYHRNMF